MSDKPNLPTKTKSFFQLADAVSKEDADIAEIAIRMRTTLGLYAAALREEFPGIAVTPDHVLRMMELSPSPYMSDDDMEGHEGDDTGEEEESEDPLQG